MLDLQQVTEAESRKGANHFNSTRIGRVRFLALLCGYTFAAAVLYSVGSALMLKVIFKVGQVSSVAGYAYLVLAVLTLGGGLLYGWLRLFRRVLGPRLLDIGFRSPMTYFLVFLQFIPWINVLIFLGMASMPANFVRE